MKGIYIRFGNPNIKGKSTDQDYQDWIGINSWSHAITQSRSPTISMINGQAGGGSEHGDMVFTKDLDLVSPLLYQHASHGTVFSEVTVDFIRPNDNGVRAKYLEIKLQDVVISSVAASVMNDEASTEQFSLKYAIVQWTYMQQKAESNSVDNVQGAWSFSQNRGPYVA